MYLRAAESIESEIAVVAVIWSVPRSTLSDINKLTELKLCYLQSRERLNSEYCE